MMSRSRDSLVVLTFALSAGFVSVALADGEDTRPIPETTQAKMLERFGDEGIDADGDGVLTRDEVKAFFADKRGERKAGKHGKHGKQGKMGREKRGMRDRGDRRGAPVRELLDRLEALNAENPPAHFNLDRFPEADRDGDGELSAAEWTTFAEQARERLLARLVAHAPEADTDEDGTINQEELAAFKAQCDARMRERILRRSPDADTDRDGVLSDSEFEAFQAQRRAKLLERHPEADLDGDGELSKEEARAFRGSKGDDRPGPWPMRGRGHRGDRPRRGAPEDF
jgi:Ca2+-binding EF-hand superfamily protein